MEKKQGTYHHGRLREALIQSALTSLSDPREAEKLSLRNLAKKAGVSHTAPYRHFSSQEELWDAVAAYGFGRLAVRQKEAAFKVNGHPSRKSMSERKLFQRCMEQSMVYIDFAFENPDLYRLMFGQRSENPSPELRVARKRSYAVLTHSMRLRTKSNEKSKYRTEAMMVWSVLHGFVSLSIDTGFPDNEAGNRNISTKQFAREVLLRVFNKEKS